MVNLLTKTVLGLVLAVCQSARSMETGYNNYPSNVSIENDIVRDDLKCTYLFGGLTHMLLTKRLLSLTGPPFFAVKMGSAVSEIHEHYSRIIKYQMDSLFNLEIERMGALWALYLYTGMICAFYGTSLNKPEAGRAIVATHGFVIVQLVNDLDDCRKHNSFDVYETIIKSNPNPSENELRLLIQGNIARAVNLLKNNNIMLPDQSENDSFDTTLQVGSIFLNNVGWKDVYKDDLMDAYNVQVDWHNTSYRLTKSWFDAHTLYWSTDKFEKLKSYFKLNFNFLKIILLRLSLKHLYYLKPYTGTCEYFIYAKQWYNLVKQFGDILSLSQDLHVKSLINAFDNLVKQEEKIGSVVSYLIAILTTLCQPLGCVATKKFEINGKEFQTPYKSPIKDEMSIEFLKMKKSPVPIEHHSLENTKMFLSYLSRMFKYVDFKIIRSLVDYITEVNPSWI